MKYLLALCVCCLLQVSALQAQDPITEIIKQGIIKVIKAVDLKIQRLQNNTIWLQNIQKIVENTMSELKLKEISDWVEKQRKLYDDYFEELWKVKAALAHFERVREIIKSQINLVQECKSAWTVCSKDKNLTKDELDLMQSVHKGLFNESLAMIDQLLLIINAFKTQMTDAARLKIINDTWDHLQAQWRDARQLSEQFKMLSIQRASERGEIDYVKKLYGL